MRVRGRAHTHTRARAHTHTNTHTHTHARARARTEWTSGKETQKKNVSRAEFAQCAEETQKRAANRGFGKAPFLYRI